MSYIVVYKTNDGITTAKEYPTTELNEHLTLCHLHRTYGKRWSKAERVYRKLNNYDGTCQILKGDY